MKKLIVETGSGTALMPRQRLLEMAMPEAVTKRCGILVEMQACAIRRALAVVLALAATVLLSAPAQAIIGGQTDGTRHPYAGAIESPPGSDLVVSGVLISPTVYLTAGHVTRRFDAAGLTRARVTFDPVVSDSSTWYTGTVHTNPEYDPQSADDPRDLGVVVFDAPIPGISPASLPTAGQLDALGPRGLSGETFTVVGYGFSRFAGGPNGGGTPQPDPMSGGTRRVARQSFLSLTQSWLRVLQHEDGRVCGRDSGAPSLFGETDVIAGINIGSLGQQCTSAAWNMRVDTPSARTFLGQFVALP